MVENIAGAGCCPGCVKYLKDGARCHADSQCANGLDCHPSKGICDVIEDKGACLRDYYNRNRFRRDKFFYVPGSIPPFKVLAIPYYNKMELPKCSHTTGDYEVKQSSDNKAYCVDSENGKAIFGVADFGKLADATCKCSNAMYQKLSKIELNSNRIDFQERERAFENLDSINTDHYADTHIKCSSTGDYNKMQCINETCLCLNEGTGVPLTTIGELLQLKHENELLAQSQKKPAKDSAKGRKNDDEDATEPPPTESPEMKKYKGSQEVHGSAVTMFGAFKALPCCK